VRDQLSAAEAAAGILNGVRDGAWRDHAELFSARQPSRTDENALATADGAAAK
jgi:hypothetical protein